MMKSWADHCSSDDEDDLAERTTAVLNDDAKAEEEDHEQLAREVPHGDREYYEEGPDKQQQKQQQNQQPTNEPRIRTYTFPDQPPFTAFVGNLNYHIQEKDDLMAQLIDVCKADLNLDLRITDCRIMFQKGTGQSRGFAYVQVETLDMLKDLMKINDANVELGGRRLQVDTAQQSSSVASSSNHHNNRNNNRHRGSNDIGGMDGNKFRGGRFSSSNQDNDNNHRASTSSSTTPSGEGNDETPTPSGPPPVRTSLKLQPRSVQKPRDTSHEGGGGGGATIFGAGKARDESNWRERKHPPADATASGGSTSDRPQRARNNTKTAAFGGSSGRGGSTGATREGEGGFMRRSGGRGSAEGGGDQPGGFGSGGRGPLAGDRRSPGRGSGGRGGAGTGGRGEPRDTTEPPKNNKESKTKKEKPAPKPVVTPSMAAATPPEPEAKKVVNKFAALALDDSDSD